LLESLTLNGTFFPPSDLDLIRCASCYFDEFLLQFSLTFNGSTPPTEDFFRIVSYPRQSSLCFASCSMPTGAESISTFLRDICPVFLRPPPVLFLIRFQLLFIRTSELATPLSGLDPSMQIPRAVVASTSRATSFCSGPPDPYSIPRCYWVMYIETSFQVSEIDLVLSL